MIGEIVPLSRTHIVESFNCGKPPLNEFLVRHATANQSNNSAQTFVAIREGEVIGYYSLAASAIVHEDAPERMAKGLARHPIPIILMARFAVDQRFQGKGIGRALFKDAVLRFLNVSKQIGARAFVVHAKDDEARAFYEALGMQSFPENPYHMFYLAKDIERSLSSD